MVSSLNMESKYLLKKLIKYSNKQTINKNTLKILYSLYEQLKKASLYTSRIDIKSHLQILNTVPKPNNFSYMQPEVKRYINNITSNYDNELPSLELTETKIPSFNFPNNADIKLSNFDNISLILIDSQNPYFLLGLLTY